MMNRNFYNFTRTRANKYARARYYNKFHFCKVDLAKLTIFAFFFKNICICQKKAVSLQCELIQRGTNTFYILTIRYSSQITFIYKQQNSYQNGNVKRIKPKMHTFM